MVRQILRLILICWLMIPSSAWAGELSSPVRIGFFEGGPYPQNEAIRAVYREQLEGMTPEGYEIIFAPNGFRSASWNRDTCRVMARQLAGMDNIDLIVALGSWVVHDLLAAGCSKPIVAVHQYDPVGDGLVTAGGRPVAPNLTISFDPKRIGRDLSYITELAPVRKLGFLHFPGGLENDSTVARVKALGAELGLEIVTAGGYDNVGTYAFFKAYQALPKDIDALYLSPLWGFDANKFGPFYEMILRDRVPSFSSEGRHHVSRGAMAGFTSDNMIAEAHYHAYKTVQIIKGAIPVELSTLFELEPTLSLNQNTAARCRVDIPRNILVTADLIQEDFSDATAFFDLRLAIEQAESANPGLQAWHRRLVAAEAQVAGARSAYRPQVGLYAKLAWVDDHTVNNSFDEVSRRQAQAAVRIDQKLFDLSAFRSTAVYEAQADGESAGVDSVRLDLEQSIALAYYDYLRLGELRKLLAEYRRRVDLFLEIAQARRELQTGEPLDAIRWQYQRLSASQLMIEAKTQQNIVRAVFNTLLGQPSSRNFQLDSLIAVPSRLVDEYSRFVPFTETDPLASQTMERLVTLGLENRPGLRSGSFTRESARLQLRRQKAAYLPRLGFQASLGVQDILQHRPGQFSEAASTWATGLRLQWPLFQGGKRSADLAYREALLNQAEYQFDEDQFAASAQIRSRTQQWLSGLLTLPVLSQSAALADYYLSETTQAYLTGTTDLTRTQDALDIWLEARTGSLSARYGYFESTVRLLRSIGGSLQDKGGTPGEALARYLTE